MWDTHAPTAQQIEVGVQWALAQRAAGRPVLVHCAHGHGRSATVLAAILIGEHADLLLELLMAGLLCLLPGGRELGCKLAEALPGQ